MVSYDAAVIKTFAQKLYERAATVVAVHAIVGILVGGVAGRFSFGNTGMFVLAAIAGAIGYFLGSQKAFSLKLQAQTALCQVQIEQNTSSPSRVLDSAPVAAASMPTAIATPTSVAAAAQSVPIGTCPSCSAAIPLAAENCPKCKASFGVGSAWKVQPR